MSKLSMVDMMNNGDVEEWYLSSIRCGLFDVEPWMNTMKPTTSRRLHSILSSLLEVRRIDHDGSDSYFEECEECELQKVLRGRQESTSLRGVWGVWVAETVTTLVGVDVDSCRDFRVCEGARRTPGYNGRTPPLVWCHGEDSRTSWSVVHGMKGNSEEKIGEMSCSNPEIRPGDVMMNV